VARERDLVFKFAALAAGTGLTQQSGIVPGNRPIYDINIVAIRSNACAEGLDALPFFRNAC